MFLTKWGKVTNLVFAKQLKNPFLKEVFSLLYEGREYPLLVMTIQLAFFSKHCAGYPVGGSLLMAKKMEERYLALGGSLSFNTSVSKIITSNQTATGVQTSGGRIIEGDIVISAADWHFTVFEALEGKFNDRNIELLEKEQILEVFDSVILISLGVSRTFNDLPHLIRFPLEQFLKLADGSEHSRIEVNIFNYDKTLSPEGKTVISVTLPTRNGDFWINLRMKNPQEYKRMKVEISSGIIDALDQRFKNIKDKVEVIDVATPATFHRYTGNWKGSIQGWLPPRKLFAPSPVKYTLPGLKNFYMSGHWTEPGGGLPIALLSARNIAQEICHNDNRIFKIK
jgi:phytoene dehydrogenase-like protein